MLLYTQKNYIVRKTYQGPTTEPLHVPTILLGLCVITLEMKQKDEMKITYARNENENWNFVVCATTSDFNDGRKMNRLYSRIRIEIDFCGFSPILI